jgi:hypothetical protein
MKAEQSQIEHSMRSTGFTRSLDLAIFIWNEARSACQHRLGEHHQADYARACDELGQAVGYWAAEQPALAEQFQLWFESHREQ